MVLHAVTLRSRELSSRELAAGDPLPAQLWSDSKRWAGQKSAWHARHSMLKRPSDFLHPFTGQRRFGGLADADVGAVDRPVLASPW